MRHFIVQMLRLSAAVLALYAGLLALSLIFVERSSDTAPIDTARAKASLYLTEPKYVFFERKRLEEARDRLLVVGASNAMVGFKPAELQPLFPERQVHNLSVGGSNITQLGQIAELVREVQEPSVRARDLYVIGVWYGIFASNKARWHTPERAAGDTDIDIERYRYGFFRRTDDGPRHVLPARMLHAGSLLVHPFLALDQGARRVTSALRSLSDEPAKLTNEQRNAQVVTPEQRRQHHRFWRRYMADVDTLDDDTWNGLSRVVDEIRGSGASVVVVDLPIPNWHSAGSPVAADYRRRFDALAPSLAARPGVQVVSLADDDRDEDFSDEVHPKPRVTARWAARLAEAVAHAPHEREEHEYRSSLRHLDSSLSRRIR